MRFHCHIWYKPLSEIYSVRVRKGNRRCSPRKDRWGRLEIVCAAAEEEKGAWSEYSEEIQRYFTNKNE